MKKLLFSILVSITMFSLVSTSLYADSKNSKDNSDFVKLSTATVKQDSPTELKVDENTVLSFESEEDKETYIKSMKNSPNNDNNLQFTPGPFDKLVYTKKPNMLFGGYFTKYWTYAPNYLLRFGDVFSFSATYSGVSLSYTRTNEVTTVVNADSSRLSRLGVYADYTIKKYRRFTPEMSGPMYFYKKTVRNSYVLPVYK